MPGNDALVSCGQSIGIDEVPHMGSGVHQITGLRVSPQRPTKQEQEFQPALGSQSVEMAGVLTPVGRQVVCQVLRIRMQAP